MTQFVYCLTARAPVLAQGGVNLSRPQRERGRDKFTSQPAALETGVRSAVGAALQSSLSNTEMNQSAKPLESAINFDSDGGAAITAPLHVGNTWRTSNQGVV